MSSIKIKIKRVIIYVLSALIFGMLIYIAELYISQPTLVKLWKSCVPDEEAAVRLAQMVCKSYWGVDIEADAFVATYGDCLFDHGWQVRLKKESDFNKEAYEGMIVMDDSGVFINAQDGTVTKVIISDSDIAEYYELKKRYQ